jgi:hypothetical protein
MSESFPRLLSLSRKLKKCVWLETLLARLCVLQAFGGIYVDYDIECVNSIDPVLSRGASALITANSKTHFGDTDVRWSFIGAEKDHPVIVDALERLESMKVKGVINKCSSKHGRAIFKVLQKAMALYSHRVTVLDPNAIIDYDARVPFMGKFTIGIYRAPRSHHYETWLHGCVRKINVWGNENPTAARVLTYFILGMITGLFLNILVYFVKMGIDRRLKRHTIEVKQIN